MITRREQVERTSASQRIAAMMLMVFGGLALVLATIGLYGVMAAAAARGARQVALRMALGADAFDVCRLVLTRGLATTAPGAAIGVAVGFQVTRLMGCLLYGVSPRDPSTFVAAVVVVATASPAACLVQTWRAMPTDPIQALRG